MGILFGLAGIAIFLICVAVVGHLLWLLGEAAVRAAGSRLGQGGVRLVPGSWRRGRIVAACVGSRSCRQRRGRSRKNWPPRVGSFSGCWRLGGFAIRRVATSSTRSTRTLEGAIRTWYSLRLHRRRWVGPMGRSLSQCRVRRRLPPAHCGRFRSRRLSKFRSLQRALVEPFTPIAACQAPETEGLRGLAGILQAFMEEKNIRWGELISGLLIVGSSVGLVISLWATLKEAIPYFPVAVFLAATTAMHGAGLYTLRRWRLRSTSRGLLLVSMLLVPLNVLAAMVLNETKPAYGTVDYAAFAIGLSVLAAIALSAARVLNPQNPWPMVVAVVGTAVGMSTIGRLARPGGEMWRTIGVFGLPFLSFLTGAVSHVVGLSAGRRLTVRRRLQSFRFYGIAGFGLALAAGFLASKCGDIRGTLSLLSPMLTAVAATITGAGLIVHQRITAPGSSRSCSAKRVEARRSPASRLRVSRSATKGIAGRPSPNNLALASRARTCRESAPARSKAPAS